MLTYRNINIIFLLILLLLVALRLTSGISSWYGIPIVAAYLVIVSYGSYNISSNFFIPVICEANISEKKIALTFDDGPAGDFTPEVLEVLKKYNVKAAFFCIGNRIHSNQEIIHSMAEEGHIIGNHSYSHHYLFDFFTKEKMLRDLSKMDEALKNAQGKKPLFFRPPYGVTTPAMKSVMKLGNYTAIGWNIRSLDTVIKNEEKLFKRVSSSLKPGAIILFHDTSKTTINILPRFIEYSISKGYTFERLDTLLNKPAYA